MIKMENKSFTFNPVTESPRRLSSKRPIPADVIEFDSILRSIKCGNVARALHRF